MERLLKWTSAIIDFGFVALGVRHPAWFALAALQYFARRSPYISHALLLRFGWPRQANGDWQAKTLVRVLFPGAAQHQETEPTAVPTIAGSEIPMVPTASPALAMPALPTMPGIMHTEQWRDAIEQSPHLLIYGPSKAGKSTLAQAVAAMFGACWYVVIDPQPNKPSERKWGGVDFVTLDETGDEFGSIRAALERIKREDNDRRRQMRTATPPPLIIIIDEVLQLVSELGTIVNEEGKKEPRMSHFIRTMGYSARHRNIKIILIGQGKNLTDLGLTSSTARNNYAIIGVSRNPATNVRSAAIETSDGDRPIDLRLVPKLAAGLSQQASLWLSHADLALPTDDQEAAAVRSLLGTDPAPDVAWTDQHMKVAAWLTAEPDITDRALARRLYPGTDGGGSYSTRAKQIRAEVLRVTAPEHAQIGGGNSLRNT